VITQSAAIARYAAKLSGLYPTNAEEALEVDEIIDTVQDILSSLPQNSDPAVLKTLREGWASGKLLIFLGLFKGKLSSSGGGFIAGGVFTIADIFLYSTLKVLGGGFFEHVPRDVASSIPELAEFITKVEAYEPFAPYKQ